VKKTDRSPLETYDANFEADAKRKAHRHSTPRLDAFRTRDLEALVEECTRKVIEFVRNPETKS
jgi:hypothetical protein